MRKSLRSSLLIGIRLTRLLFASMAVMVIKFRSRLTFSQRKERISPFLKPVFRATKIAYFKGGCEFSTSARISFWVKILSRGSSMARLSSKSWIPIPSHLDAFLMICFTSLTSLFTVAGVTRVSRCWHFCVSLSFLY